MGKKLYTAVLDNTLVNKPLIIPTLKMKDPSPELQEQMKSLGYYWDGNNWRYAGTISLGEPPTDNRTATERNKNYWHPIKGVKERVKASMNNETNPYIGIKRTILPAAETALTITGLKMLPGLFKTIRSKPLRTIWNILPETVVGYSTGKAAEYGDKLLGGDGSIGFAVGGLAGINQVLNWFNRARKAFYRHVTPFGYGNFPVSRKLELKEIAKEVFLSKAPQPINEPTPWLRRTNIDIIDGNAGLSTAANVRFRDLAVRQAMNLKLLHFEPQIYKLNPDGTTYSYDIANVNAIRLLSGDVLIPENVVSNHLLRDNGSYGDIFTGNGGVVGITKENGNTYMEDIWDIQPFNDHRSVWEWGTNHIPGLKNVEVIDFLRGNPFKVKHKLND